MTEPMDDYIRQNRGRYTDEAIREQLIVAGHDPAAINEVWGRLEAEHPTVAAGWRVPRWMFAVLVVGGSVGAGVAWAGQPYGAGGIAPFAYLVIASIALLIGRWVASLVDRGSVLLASIIVLLVGAPIAWSMLISRQPVLAVVAGITAGAIVATFFGLRRSHAHGVAMLAAAMPIVFWLIVTGVCYSPLLGR